MAGEYVDMDKQLSNRDSEVPYVDSTHLDFSTSLVPYENTIDLGHNIDGSKKYSFQSIYKDKELINNAKEFYEERDGTKFENDEDVVDQYISDRTWKQANITSALVELNQVKNQMGKDQLKRLKYLTEYWYKMPNFWEEGGRSASSAIFQNMRAGILDWANVGSMGFGALVTKTVGKQALKQYGKNALKNQIGKLTLKGTAATTVFDAATFAGADLAIQEAERTLKLRKKYDFKRTAITSVFGGGISILPNGFANYSAIKLVSDIDTNASRKSISSPSLKKTVDDLDSAGKEKDTVEVDIEDLGSSQLEKQKKVLFTGEKKRGLRWQLSYAKQKIFDRDNFYKIFQKVYTGVTGSVRGGKAAVDVQLPVTKEVEKLVKEGRIDEIPIEYIDPSQLTYFKRKDTTASALRSDEFLESGVSILKPVIDKTTKKIKMEYVATGNRGLYQILADMDNYGEGDLFVKYMLAKRSQHIIRQNDLKLAKNPKAKIQVTPFHPSGKIKGKAADVIRKRQEAAKKNIKELIDYAELTPDQYSARYTKDGFIPDGRNANADFVKAAKEWKLFFDDMLDYAHSKGLHSADDIAKMKADNPYGYIPMKTVKSLEVQAFDPGTSKAIAGVSGAGTTRGKKKLISGRKPLAKVIIAPLARTSAEYVHHATKAADINAEKLAFYRQLAKLSDEEQKFIATKAKLTKSQQQIIFVDPLLNKLKAEGIELDDATRASIKAMNDGEGQILTMGIQSSIKHTDGRVFDVVYNPATGKREIYQIHSALLQDSLNTLKDPGGTFQQFMSKVYKTVRAVGRLPARAITYSPPFVAFNFIRDSLSATINSAFGVNPLRSVKGFMLTFGGDANGSNMNKYVNAFRRNNEFRLAIISGLGQSTRKEVERYGLIDNVDNFGKSAANGWYKKTINAMRGSVFGRGAKGYAELVSRIEYASRLAEFNAAKKYGLSSTMAAIAGREVSTDFAMRGSSKILNNYASVTMFFNAGLQGFYRGSRNFLEGEGIGKTAAMQRVLDRRAGKNVSTLGSVNGRAIVAVSATVVAPEMLFHLSNRDLPEYQDVPDEIKMLNFLWPIYEDPKEDGSHLHMDGSQKVKYFFAVPKPYDFGVFGNVATGIYEGIIKKSPGLAAEYIGQSFTQIMPGLAAPTLANPWVHIMLNKNWQGDEILPHGYKSLPASEQIKSNTRKSAVMVSNFIRLVTGKAQEIRTGSSELTYKGTTISPVILDYIMAGYFTGIASYPLDMLDSMLYDEKKFGEKPTKRRDVADIWKEPWSIVTRRFQVDVPVKNSQNMKIFYDIRNKARKLKAGVSYDMKDLESVFGLTFADDLQYKEVQESLYISDWFSFVAQELKRNRDSINKIRLTKDYKGFPDVTAATYSGLSEAERKKKDIDTLMQLNNDIANGVIQDLRNANFETIQKDVFGYTKYEENKKPKKNKSSILDMDF